MTKQGVPAGSERTVRFCPRCGHEDHDQRSDPRCPEIIGVHGPDNLSEISYEPEHCGCVDVDALWARLLLAESRLR